MTAYEFWAIVIQSVTSVILIGTLVLIWFQYRGSNREFKARMRPYLGIDVFKQVPSADPKSMEFEAYIRNSGNLPARNIEVSGKFKCADDEVTFKCPTKGVAFPSDKTEQWTMGLSDIPKNEIGNGSKVLQVEIKIEYYGPEGDAYSTTKKGHWDAQRNYLVNVEDNCS